MGEKIWQASFRPASIAVVGVSTRPGTISRRAVQALRRFGYPGPLFLVHREAEEIDGLRCYRSLGQLPGPVDLALLFTRADRTPELVREAAAAGARAAILFASGFAEMGPTGRKAQEELRGVAAEAGIRVLGPNCQGLVHLPNHVAATFSNSVSAPDLPPVAPVAYVGQSGALGGSVFDLLRARGFIPAVQVSTGNQLDVTVTEVARHLVGNDEVALLMLYLEQIPDGGIWETLCTEAQSAGKQIIVLRGGTTPAGRRAAASHTGAIVGGTRAFELVSERFGVPEVADVDDWVDAAVAWHAGGCKAGRRLGVVSTSGAAGSLAADHAPSAGLQLPELAPVTRARLREVLPAYASTANPVDVTAPSGAPALASGENAFEEACQAVADDPGVDQLMVILTVVVGPVGEEMTQGVVNVATRSAVPVHVVFLAAPDRTTTLRQRMTDAGVALYGGIRRAQQAIAVVAPPARQGVAPPAREGVAPPARQGVAPPAREGVAPPAREGVAPHQGVDAEPVEDPLGAGPVDAEVEMISEARGADLLDAHGVPRPAGSLVHTRDEAAAMALEVGGGVVMKLQSPAILHKSDLGAVRLSVAPGEAAAVFDSLVALGAAAGPQATVEGVLVQVQVDAGAELLVGVQGPDNGYPPVVTVGMGGTAVEVYADAVSALAPLDTGGALDLLARLRGWPLLTGHRGGPRYDTHAAARAIAALGALAVSLGERLIELEVNPLIVHEAGRGAHAADFLARVRRTGSR